MAKFYDTQFLRRLALALDSSAAAIKQADRLHLGFVREDLPQQLKGDAAQALEDEVTESGEKLNRISGDVSDVSKVLIKYAAVLDSADAHAAEMIQKH